MDLDQQLVQQQHINYSLEVNKTVNSEIYMLKFVVKIMNNGSSEIRSKIKPREKV